MATSAISSSVSVGEYLASVYRPDVDYVDGVLEARNVGEFDHGDVQLALGTLLRLRQGNWGVRAVAEVRVQVAPTRFRIPDICVVRAATEREQIIRTAPLLCVEVLSPKDTLQRMRVRCGDYLAMGVGAVWILDPSTRTAHVLDGVGMRESRDGMLRVDGTAVEVGVAEIFSTLD